MINGIHFVALVLALSAFGCGTSPVKGNFLSGEKNIWIADPNSADVSYCVANSDGTRADPTCYMAHRAQMGESGYSSRRSAPAAPISSPASVVSTPATDSTLNQSVPAKKD